MRKLIQEPRFLTIFASSSDGLPKEYYHLAEELGVAMVKSGYHLVYGGARIGLMGTLARTVKKEGGQVIGVIPQRIHERGLAFEEADQIIVTKTMRERKAKMESLCSGFIALPGGFGTLEEILEILTLKQLGYLDAPVILLNFENCFAGLLAQFDSLIEQKFAKVSALDTFYVCTNVQDAIAHLQSYKPPKFHYKWVPKDSKRQ